MAYQIRGSDLIAWRDWVRDEPRIATAPVIAQSERLQVINLLPMLTDDEVHTLRASALRMLDDHSS